MNIAITFGFPFSHHFTRLALWLCLFILQVGLWELGRHGDEHKKNYGGE
jgi:hypothetical protein